MRDITAERPERFKRAVRAACCDACDWPECGCETTAEIVRKAINQWNHIPVDESEPDWTAADAASMHN